MLGAEIGVAMRGFWPVLMLTALLLLVVALQDRLRRLEHGRLREGIQTAAAPETSSPLADPALRPLALLENGLMERLQEADRAWIPRAEPLPGGGIRYLYRRRTGEPQLTVGQIRSLIATPLSHAEEQRSIVALLTTLERVGVRLGLIEPIKEGAAAEWDPKARTLRIRPDVPDQGSLELARVLNHEAIHVAQSCAAGGVGAFPRPLGLEASGGTLPGDDASRGPEADHRSDDPGAIRQLQYPLYADLTPAERRMEQEAYALQARLDLGVKMLRIHCMDRRPD